MEGNIGYIEYDKRMIYYQNMCKNQINWQKTQRLTASCLAGISCSLSVGTRCGGKVAYAPVLHRMAGQLTKVKKLSTRDEIVEQGREHNVAPVLWIDMKNDNKTQHFHRELPCIAINYTNV